MAEKYITDEKDEKDRGYAGCWIRNSENAPANLGQLSQKRGPGEM
jgi:hypothetical protein